MNGHKNTKQFKIYSVKNYKDATKKFINENAIIYTDIKELIDALKKDNYYHFRIHNNENYIFFGDIDNLKITIEEFKIMLIDFLRNNYNLVLEDNEFKYTQNNVKNNSYHYSIPKWNCSTEKLKEIHINLIKEYPILKKSIDTTIYSEHWFRCPNQSKGNVDITKQQDKHIIIHGNLKNCIIDYISAKSINIENCELLTKEVIIKSSKKSSKIENTKNNENLELKDESILELKINDKKNNEIITKKSQNEIVLNDASNTTDKMPLCKYMAETDFYKKIFDECYEKQRFEKYEYWVKVGMSLMNTFDDTGEAFELFNYYSSKGSNYEGIDKTRYKFYSFEKRTNGITINTIYMYAIEDNKPKFIEILNRNSFELEETDMCKYLKFLMGYNFIYIVKNGVYKLYCYNKKYWVQDDIIMRDCISTHLYEFLKSLLTSIYWNTPNFTMYKSKIDRLKKINMKKNIIESYKEIGVRENVIFDEKWWLFSFNNIVYDLQKGEFREHKYDDYVSITTGYDWIEPTIEEMNTIKNLIEKIMPIEEERETLLQVLSTGLEGRCLEKFIVFNGNGGNGKGLLNDLFLLTLGNYGMIGNNSILFENSRTGSNPEKANIHKKRYVVFREPPERAKFENSIVKELSGGGSYSARGHFESDCSKELNLTMVVECNKRPLFAEEPTNAEIRRILDIYFKSSFTEKIEDVNENNFVFLANPIFKLKEFQQKHKCALFKYLITEHKKYLNNGSILKIAKSITERTQLYLELSCNIVQWFKDNYKHTGDKKDFLKIKDIYDNFTSSEFYTTLTKMEKRKYNKTFFIEYFEKNIFLSKYFYERHLNTTNIIKEWIQINEI